MHGSYRKTEVRCGTHLLQSFCPNPGRTRLLPRLCGKLMRHDTGLQGLLRTRRHRKAGACSLTGVGGGRSSAWAGAGAGAGTEAFALSERRHPCPYCSDQGCPYLVSTYTKILVQIFYFVVTCTNKKRHLLCATTIQLLSLV